MINALKDVNMIHVAQCWDDGVVNDARLTDILRKYHAKATFNINPGSQEQNTRTCTWKYQDFDVSKLSLSEMPSVYEGFQVASHTMRHQRADAVPVEDFVRSALDARHFIEDHFQQEAPGFAWPCGVTTDETVRALTESGFAYGRTVRYVDSVLPVAEPLRLHSNCHFLNPAFWEIFDKASPSGVFYFWGHSYELKEDEEKWEAFESKIARLSGLPDVQWFDVIDIVR